MNKTAKRNLKIGAGVAALAFTIGGSFAYFTDYADTSASGTAGTVDITLDATGIVLTDELGQDILNPGDMRAVSYSVTNDGNKSIDVRTTITVTSSVAMNKEADQAEFEIYKLADVELVEGEGYKPVEGAMPLAVKSISEDGKVITYKPADIILNGTGDIRETEADVLTSGTNVTVSEAGDSVAFDYVLVFKGEASNDFQAATVSIDLLVEAKQHRNTGAGWELVAEDGYTVDAAN